MSWNIETSETEVRQGFDVAAAGERRGEIVRESTDSKIMYEMICTGSCL